MKSARTKACEIPLSVKEKVAFRDHGLCVICGKAGAPNMHYKARSAGGLGIEQNIVCGCAQCHFDYDNGAKHKENGEKIRAYLQEYYGPEWKEKDLIYDKAKRWA
jgi:nitrite reductase/ring-hydroxylating ferredoxin subunit